MIGFLYINHLYVHEEKCRVVFRLIWKLDHPGAYLMVFHHPDNVYVKSSGLLLLDPCLLQAFRRVYLEI